MVDARIGWYKICNATANALSVGNRIRVACLGRFTTSEEMMRYVRTTIGA